MGFFICIDLEWDSVAHAAQLLRKDCDSNCTETLEEEARERNGCFDTFRLTNLFIPYAPTSKQTLSRFEKKDQQQQEWQLFFSS